MPADKCKIPTYLAHDPVTWFRACEACFLTHKVTKSSEKAALVLAALPEEQLQNVAYLLVDAEDSTSYEDIKDTLVQIDGPSFQEAVERFLALPLLRPGERPSSYLRHLCGWLPEDLVESPFTRALFLSKMPGDLKRLLLSQEQLSLRQLAVHGDRLSRAGGPSSAPKIFHINTSELENLPVSSVESPPTPSVNAVRSSPRSRARRQSQPQKASRPVQLDLKPGVLGPDGVCFFHAKYGQQARSCVSGCAKQKNGGGAGC